MRTLEGDAIADHNSGLFFTQKLRKLYLGDQGMIKLMSTQEDKNEKITNLFKYQEDKWFPLFISIVNALVYAFILLMVTHVDKNYENVIYGLREYPLGNWVGLISIPAFIITYLSIKLIKSPLYKVSSIFVSSVIILAILSVTNFNIGNHGQVEMPNMALAAFLLLSETTISVITFMHYRKIDFKYITEDNIAESAKIQRLQFEYNMYSRVLLTIIAAFLGAFYTMYCNITKVFETFTKNVEATTLIFNNMLLAMSVFAILIIILTIQVLVIVFFAAEYLTHIEVKPDKSG